MLPPSVTFLLLCLFTWSAESTVISQEPGERITLDCSDDGCPQSTTECKGLYLYHELNKKKEVLFVSTATPQQITARSGYEGRIQRHESDFFFTISNLTEDDSGLYRCVYKKIDGSAVDCSVYAVFITEMTSSCSSPAPTAETSPPSMLFIIVPCVVCLLIIWIFFLLIIPRVKRWCSQRGSARRVSKECVYEDMRKNLSPSAAPLEQSHQMF